MAETFGKEDPDVTELVAEDVGLDDAGAETSEPVEGRRQRAAKAPYMSYPGFQKVIDQLREDGVPGRFDKSYFPGQSGSLIAQTRGTLRYFELIDDDQHPTKVLTELVEADPDGQKEVLRRLLMTGYEDALALSKNATVGQLADVFRMRGLSGATVQKAIGFFVSMAEDVDVEVSPLFKKGRMASSAGNGPRKKRPTKSAQPSLTPPAPQHTNTKTPSAEEQKAAYVQMLMDLAKDNDAGVQEGLLDRIEKALGIASPAPRPRGSDLPQEE